LHGTDRHPYKHPYTDADLDTYTDSDSNVGTAVSDGRDPSRERGDWNASQRRGHLLSLPLTICYAIGNAIFGRDPSADYDRWNVRK